jgi:hypothetical protein
MLRVLFVFGLCFFYTANLSFAADLPLMIEQSQPIHHKKKITFPAKQTALHAKKTISKKTASKPQLIALLPAPIILPVEKPPTPVAPRVTNNLSWVLGPMVANADGGKRESSASATANIVVDRPGDSFGPEMVIELEGHVVKTAQATVRVDIHIGSMKKTLEWKADEIKAGIFKITFNEIIPPGVLPKLIPVSALAFVTQTGDGHAAMVSLEKIMLHFSGPQVVGTK